MKKIDFKKLFIGLLLIYTHWTCWDHCRSIGNHASNLMQWVEAAGSKAGHAAAGLVNK